MGRRLLLAGARLVGMGSRDFRFGITGEVWGGVSVGVDVFSDYLVMFCWGSGRNDGLAAGHSVGVFVLFALVSLPQVDF